MNFQNCPRCGKLFQRTVNPICESCTKEEEQQFESLKDYINANPGHDVETISEATGMTAKRILKYLREGRLEATNGMGNQLKCESCGKKIGYGRYCETCIINIGGQINEAFTKSKYQGSGMHSKR
jgi:predicted amidophosphoribosyltransferase